MQSKSQLSAKLLARRAKPFAVDRIRTSVLPHAALPRDFSVVAESLESLEADLERGRGGTSRGHAL